MFVRPSRRRALVARFRRLAMTCGPKPFLPCERSSSKTTSRTQWSRFWICQCPRVSAARSSGVAYSGVKLVMQCAIFLVVRWPFSPPTSRRIRKTWAGSGRRRTASPLCCVTRKLAGDERGIRCLSPSGCGSSEVLVTGLATLE